MHLRATTSLFRNESGQAAVEFAILVPFLIAILFLIVSGARAFNAYNDLNQMAADGARFAAVGNFPGASALLARTADTSASQTATICGPIYLSDSDPSPTDSSSCPLPGTCAVGKRIWLRADATVSFLPLPIPVATVTDHRLVGKAEMRVERCPTP
jgi:Flp pilus assembly pilin Flp